MLARRVTSLAVGDPASQLISQRLMGHFLHVCICPPCLRLTMPRGYERSRAVHQTNHATEFERWGGKGGSERAGRFNKHRMDRWLQGEREKRRRRGNKRYYEWEGEHRRDRTVENPLGRKSSRRSSQMSRLGKTSNTTKIVTHDTVYMLDGHYADLSLKVKVGAPELS